MKVDRTATRRSRRTRGPERSAPGVSVVIPTFERRELAVRAVRELAHQTVDPSSFEVIVVVDGSTDGSAEALRGLDPPMRLTVLEQPNRGRPLALNAGAEAASGDVLLFLDDDMVADPRMIEEHLRTYEQLGADAVLGALAHDPRSASTVLSEEVRRWIEEDFDDARSAHELVDPARPRFIGGQFSVRRNAFDRLGGFDNGFNRGRGFGNADRDLSVRLQATGGRVAFNGGALSTQTYVHGYRSIWRIFELMGRSDVAFDRKFPERDARKTRPVPDPGTRKGFLATGTLRHPFLASTVAAPIGLVAGPLVDRGARDTVTRKLGYATLTHRYWYGVAMEGGGHDLGVGGPDPLLAVLAYHRLSPPPSPRHAPWATAPTRMAAQIRAAVEDGWQLVTPEEAAAFLSGSVRLPLRSLLVTFDDGYADLAERGAPVLRELGASAVAFVVAGRIGARAEWSEDPGPEPTALLDGDTMLALAAEGLVEFGAHGMTHTAMPKLDDTALRSEVEGPRRRFEELGLPPPRFLAYPYGEHDARVRRAAASYLGAFTTRDGLIAPDADWTRLPRVEVLAGLSPSGLVWRLRRLWWTYLARQVAASTRRRASKLVGPRLP